MNIFPFTILDACFGDSGGGLVSSGKLIGIISYSIGCDNEDFPGVYTNIVKYHKWIYSIIKS